MSGRLENQELKLITSHLHDITEESIKELQTNWISIYGSTDTDAIKERLKTVQDDLKKFWEDQIEDAVNTMNHLVVRVESLAKEAFNLEKVLGLPSNSTSQSLSDAPLVKLEDKLKKLVSSYNEIKKERMREYLELKDQENELCEILGETPQLLDYNSPSDQTFSENKSPRSYIPNGEDVAAAVTRIETLRSRQVELENEFDKLKCELKTILEECEIRPFNKVENAAFGYDVVFPCTKMNLEMLVETTVGYRLVRADLSAKANELRNQISSLWTKMLKDQDELQDYLAMYKGFTNSTITQLEEKLKELKLERKEKMKELILASRVALDELWTRCCYTDEQRSQFKPYYVNHYNEDVLDLHELEVERLQFFFEEHKHIYQLAARHEELWERLLHLEEQAKRSDRLFKNRGGQLLLEEKERKLVQKKLPIIKKELISLLEQYKNTTGSDFLYFGEPLLEILEQKEEERKASKENEKLQRKAANVEALQLESRLGARPATTIAGGKRKLLTPQSTNQVNRDEAAALRKRMQSPSRPGCSAFMPRTPSSKTPVPRTPASKTPMPRTPAASDLNNGSPTYESFQEHMNTMSNEGCLSSTKDLGKSVLRPRNLRTRADSPRVTPYKTPSKTPTKIPFRIATGSKIPSVVPPISPRSAHKLTASRVKLPIIF
ncbi:protein regulator of cytokinesis 1-like isoform X3 [Homalodisca vitripennis]|uniref:protein regulator of cytokinesis 1-like isoform X3 n=1 Tax=Homalodisca vitripennis TaxID=197043 RepID=UPI001EEC0E79|nr:protein regulator of cytokinesis 1-like isoform X3 [Homalodisca vitripennis]